MSSEGAVANGNNVSNGTDVSEDGSKIRSSTVDAPVHGGATDKGAKPSKGKQKKGTKRTEPSDNNDESDPTPLPSDDTQENEENMSQDEDQSDHDTRASVGDEDGNNGDPYVARVADAARGSTVARGANVDGKEEQSRSNMSFYVGILIVGIFVAAVVAIVLALPQPVKPDFDYVKIFDNGMDELPSSFTNQSDRFWKILKNRGLAHLRRESPSQPLVILLAAPPSAHDTVDYLATTLAGLLDPKHMKTLAEIDGENEKNHPGDETKMKIDDILTTKFQEGHRAAVVHRLELLPWPSPLQFYSYCDNENAPHKHVAILFTVHLPAAPDSSLLPKWAEGTVEKYLSATVWSAYDKDAVGALLSRITDTVVLVN